MAFWNTLFVEVPIETFAPVKSVLDLLRPEPRVALELHEASVGTLLARARRAFRAAYGGAADAS